MWRSALALLTCALAAASRLPGRNRPRLIDGRLRSLAETAAVTSLGYEILFHRLWASKKFQRYAFWARQDGKTVGRLEIDFIPSRSWTYVGNIYVVEAHRNRGVGAALLVCATRWTGCTVLTTSLRTRCGVAFFAKNRTTLRKYGVELTDRPPTTPVPDSPAGARSLGA